MKKKKTSLVIGTSAIVLIVLVSAFRGMHKAVKKSNEKKKQSIVSVNGTLTDIQATGLKK